MRGGALFKEDRPVEKSRVRACVCGWVGGVVVWWWVWLRMWPCACVGVCGWWCGGGVVVAVVAVCVCGCVWVVVVWWWCGCGCGRVRACVGVCGWWCGGGVVAVVAVCVCGCVWVVVWWWCGCGCGRVRVWVWVGGGGLGWVGGYELAIAAATLPDSPPPPTHACAPCCRIPGPRCCASESAPWRTRRRNRSSRGRT